MENKIHKKGTLEVEELLLRRIQELEHVHADLKQNMLKLMTSRVPQKSRPKAASSFNHSNGFGMHSGTFRVGHRVAQMSAFKLTEAQYFNILETINQQIHIINAKGCIIYRNRAWEDFYGFSSAESLGKSLFELLIDPKDAQIANDFLKNLLAGETWIGDFPIRNKKGERFLAFGSCSPLSDENGTIVGIISATAVIRPDIHLQQPLQSATVSKISDLATKVKSKMKKGEKCMHHTDDAAFENFSSSVGRSLDSRSCRFCWHWFHGDQENEYDVEMSFSIPDNGESQPRVNAHNLYEIKWEDLIFRERIGRGSYGTVYHAVWNGSDVALKLLPKQEHSHDMIHSFEQEAYLMRVLHHPNILHFMGTVNSFDYICIVTEFLCRIKGSMTGHEWKLVRTCGSLFNILHRSTARLHWVRRVHMALDIARGMNYLHKCFPPIIHCDLKSLNLLVDKNWTVKIGDFGLCRIKHEAYVTTKEEIETPEWMAPEVLRDEKANEKSDVYSYGVVLWEITTEKIPWDGLKKLQIMKAVGYMNQRLDIPKDVDPQWASLIERCLCSEPMSRPTFGEIVDELEELQKKCAIQVGVGRPPLLYESTAKRNCKYGIDA
ncbi:PAS domain-containing protein tyrosine kinase family protein [Tanacetum coccineum]|uniref:PAS domain-containing protein tyrosine kinase family protein n=1 Tax=Tanacetum coccineum TaxID=301880 RepID=A0ABQ5BX53_9ASTR